MNPGVIVFVVLVVLSFLGLPVFEAVAAGTMLAMLYGGFPLETLAQKTFLGLNSAALLSIPFFILAGNLMAHGITQKLINVANVLLGRVRGALGAVTVLASALFGAISGSAVATVAAIGGMTIPAMKKEGYDENYTVALASAASLLGPMIPPSITLIVYAGLTDASVQKLFIATLTPAILCTVGFLAYTLWYGKKKDLPKQPKKTAKEAGHILLDAVWALLLPVIVLGLIDLLRRHHRHRGGRHLLHLCRDHRPVCVQDPEFQGASQGSGGFRCFRVRDHDTGGHVEGGGVCGHDGADAADGFHIHHLHHQQPVRGAAHHQCRVPDPGLPHGLQLHPCDDGPPAADAGEGVQH